MRQSDAFLDQQRLIADPAADHVNILTDRVDDLAGRRDASFSIPVPSEMQQHWSASGVFPAIDAPAAREG